MFGYLIGGGVLILAGAMYCMGAALGVKWLLPRSWGLVSLQTARVLGAAAGMFAIFLGLFFWAVAGISYLSRPNPQQVRAAMNRPLVVPRPVTRPAADYAMLGSPVALTGGYTIRPPKDYVADPIVQDAQRTLYCWRHPSDPRRFAAIAITANTEHADLLSPHGKRLQSSRSQFVVERYRRLQAELGGPVTAKQNREIAANHDGLIMFGFQAANAAAGLHGSFFIGHDNGRLIEFIYEDIANHNQQPMLNSLERSDADEAGL